MGETTPRERVLVIGDALRARAQEARSGELHLEFVADLAGAHAALAREPASSRSGRDRKVGSVPDRSPPSQ